MALLKDTYIEGNLTVEGSLLAGSLAGKDGIKFPYVDEAKNGSSNATNRIAKFSNDRGGLVTTPLKVEQDAESDVVISTEDENNYVAATEPTLHQSLNIFIGQPGYKIFVKKTNENTQIRINNNEENPKWFFPNK